MMDFVLKMMNFVLLEEGYEDFDQYGRFAIERLITFVVSIENAEIMENSP